MPRKTIELPAKFIFSTEYDVLYTDVNSANHLGADRVLPIAMEAQLRFIKHLGYADAIAFEDAGLIMGHSEVVYIGEAGYGDRLLVELGATDFGDKNFQLRYQISKLKEKTEMARVVTTLLFFDYASKSVLPIPANFRARIESLA